METKYNFRPESAGKISKNIIEKKIEKRIKSFTSY